MSAMARVGLQRFWRFLYYVAIAGLGHMNPDPRRNGEERHLLTWATNLSRSGRLAPVVLDVGANEGDFAASVLRLLPRAHVHCFEAHPATSTRLQQRFANDDRVTVNAVGVADGPGSLTLHDYRGALGSAHASFLSETFTDVYAAETDAVEVPLTSVDDYLEAHAIDQVDYVKIDVEGFERSVFLGMTRALAAGHVDHIHFEFNAHNALTGFTLHEVGQMLDGYDVDKLLANGSERIIGSGVAYEARIEIFKYANYVAIRRSG